MSAYDTLRAAADEAGGCMIMVSRLDLAEVLAEVIALRTGGVAKPGTKYTAEFEEAWTLYPNRPGMSKAAAFKAWTARLKAGATALEMIEGTRKYANYCQAERTEAHYIKQPATFYGPGEHFSADWTPAKVRRGPADLGDVQRANSEAASRLLRGEEPDDGMVIDEAR